MPEPLDYIAPGSPAFPTINAGMLNAIISAVKGIQTGKNTSRSDTINLATDVVYAINNSPTNADIYDVLTFDNVGLTIANEQDQINFQRRPLFSIITPATSDDFPVVALEPIPRYAIGRVAIGGIVTCTVNVTDAAHEYANPTAGNRTKMTSAATGQCRILWKDTGTGDKTAVVYLYQSSGGSCDTWLSVEPLLTATCSGGDIVTTTLTGYEFCVREA